MHRFQSRMRTAALSSLLVLAVAVLSGCASPGFPGAPGAPSSPADPPTAVPDDQPSASGGDTSTAECVMGSWQLDKSSLIWTIWADDELNEVSGDIYVHFTEAEFYGIEYDEVVIFRPIIEEFDYMVETTWDGISSGFYEVRDDDTVAMELEPEATVSTVMTYPDRVERDSYTVGHPFPIFYTCDGDRLEAHPQEEPTTVVMVFDRID